jgi:hypothetical protein
VFPCEAGGRRSCGRYIAAASIGYGRCGVPQSEKRGNASVRRRKAPYFRRYSGRSQGCCLHDGERQHGSQVRTSDRDCNTGDFSRTVGAFAQSAFVTEWNIGIFLPEVLSPVPKISRAPQNFMGFRREDGRVGIRNEVWIIPTVGCVSSVVKEIAARVQDEIGPSVDGTGAPNSAMIWKIYAARSSG